MRRLCLAIVGLMLAAAPAAAGGCCGHATAAYDIQPVVPVATYRFDAPAPVGQIYVANQGPLLSGPGLYTYTNHYVPSFVPTAYPYVSGQAGWRGYGCCGYRYSYSYSYGCGCGAARAYWPNTVASYRWYGGYHAYRSYRGYRRHAAPLATNHVAPSSGY